MLNRFKKPKEQAGAALTNGRETALVDAGKVYEIGQRGIRVAEAIAAEETFNYRAAEMSMRTLAGLANRMRVTDYADVPSEDKVRMRELAGRTARFLHGADAEAQVERVLQTFRPTTADEADLHVMKSMFNALQIKVSIGEDTENSYRAEDVPALRQFVPEYAQVFAGALFGLSSAGNRLITTPSEMAYVESTIDAATPASMRPQSVVPGLHVEYL
jgi:hypothetical protein